VASVLVTLAVIVLRKRLPSLLAAWLCYGLLLMPVLGVAQSGVQVVADRYSYLAGLSIAMVVSAAVVRGWQVLETRRWRLVLGAVVCMVLLAWCGLTVRQTRVWQDEETLWLHTLRGGPSAMAYNNLGALALQDHGFNAALEYFTSAVATIPTYARARGNLLNALMDAPDGTPQPLLDRAEEVLRSIADRIATGPEEPFVRGTLALRSGRFEQAADDLRFVVALKPDLARGWIGLGRALCGAGRVDEAIDALQTAIETRPDLIEPRIALAECLMSAGRRDEASAAVGEALRIDPHDQRAVRLLRELQSASPAKP
jgi:tetratricopeptide (TPR) repeat protein